MTYGKEYTLADKMQKQFKNRGADVSGMQASSTSDLMRRAEMGKDPRVNCAEQAFRESYRTRKSPAGETVRSSSGQQTRTASTNRNAQASAAKAGTYDSRTRTAERTRSSSAGNGARVHAKANAKKQTSRRNNRRPADYSEPIVQTGEIAVKPKIISPQFIVLLVIATVMIMILVLAFSDAYQTTGEIAKLENQLEALKTEADELRLQLDEKNDIRTIEEIATTKLGMVKEDSLQRRYVSLSDGEYIELLNTEEDSDEQTGGVLLSSIFSSLGSFFERFK